MCVKKKHARTCSTACRVALSNIMRYGTEEEEVTEEEREAADERIAEVKGEIAPESSILKKVSRKDKKKKDDEEEVSD